MKKVFALLLALTVMLGTAAFAEEAGEAVPSPTAGASVISNTGDGVTVIVTDAEDDDKVTAIVNAIEQNGDNSEVFKSAELDEDMTKYELIELVGVDIVGYDAEKNDDISANIKFAGAFEQGKKLIVLLGVVEDNRVVWQPVSFTVEADGTMTINLTEKQAEIVAAQETVIAVLQEIAE